MKLRTRRTTRWETWREPAVFRCGPSRLPTAGGAAAGASRCSDGCVDEDMTPVALVPVQAARRPARAGLRAARSRRRSQPVDLELAGRIAPTAWMFYRTLPDERLEKSDLIRFSLSLPGLGRELWMVFFDGPLRRAPRLVDSRCLRHPRRSGPAAEPICRASPSSACSSWS